VIPTRTVADDVAAANVDSVPNIDIVVPDLRTVRTAGPVASTADNRSIRSPVAGKSLARSAPARTIAAARTISADARSIASAWAVASARPIQ
jgi:hypothetical protein